MSPGRIETVLKALGLRDLDAFKGLLDLLLGPKESLTDDEIKKFSAIAVKARNMTNTLTKPTEADLAGLYRRSFQ